MRSKTHMLRFRPLLRKKKSSSKGGQSPDSNDISSTNSSADEFSAPSHSYSEPAIAAMNNHRGILHNSNSSNGILKDSDDPRADLRSRPRKISFLDSGSSDNEIEHEHKSGEFTVEEEEGDDADEIKNLDRLSMRIDGFECYVLVGLWVSTSCFGDLLVGDFRNRQGALPASLRNAAVVIGLFVCLSGLYSTVVFATTILYGKTAVGLNRDVAFFSFMQNTAPQRSRAFQCLQYSTMAYTILVCLVASNELPNVYYVPPVMTILGYVLYRGAKDITDILSSASPIYAPPAAAQKEEDSDELDSEDEDLINLSSRRLGGAAASANSHRFGGGPDLRQSLMAQNRALDSVHFLHTSTRHKSKSRSSLTSVESNSRGKRQLGGLDYVHKSVRKSRR